jgi:hypothetical protein
MISFSVDRLNEANVGQRTTGDENVTTLTARAKSKRNF